MTHIRLRGSKLAVHLALLPPVLMASIRTFQKLVVVHRAILRPHSPGRPKIRNAALRANASAGQRDCRMRCSEPFSDLIDAGDDVSLVYSPQSTRRARSKEHKRHSAKIVSTWPVAVEMLNRRRMAPRDLVAVDAKYVSNLLPLRRAGRPAAQRNRCHARFVEPATAGQFGHADGLIATKIGDGRSHMLSPAKDL